MDQSVTTRVRAFRIARRVNDDRANDADLEQLRLEIADLRREMAIVRGTIEESRRLLARTLA